MCNDMHIVLLTIITISYGDKLEKTYLPPDAHESGGSDIILQAPTTKPIVVLDNEDLQRQIAGSAQEEIQRPIVNNVEKVLETYSAALQRPIGNNQAENDVVHIGNRGNIFIHNPNPVDHNEVSYPGLHYQGDRGQITERAQASLERNAAILRQDFKLEGDAYAYAYETENGIWAEENGVATNGVNSQGAYSYIGDDGIQYSMSYTADENGFQPLGDHIPTSPPIPEEILKSLEQNARDEAAGIFDDGSYDERKYGEDEGSQQIRIVTGDPSYPRVTSLPTVIDQVTSNENSVVIGNPLPKYRNPGYIYPAFSANHNNVLAPVVNTLIPEVTPSTVTKGYLPPVKRKAPSDNRPSKFTRKSMTVTKKPKPEYKKKENKP
ncbi:jg13448 [Pararge aegeria aegeria]|uniref:Jg13448 protein n=1 Tax=Pararge aegeria aegeria TaxID=348720 RepID=A0A8S4RT44_9NEOP|nr:jg13448 [Pararge aegeria aegeria]